MKVVTTTSESYATSFGFTEQEVFAALEEYVVTSNRESGFGRYDVMLEPKNPGNRDAIILEFKVHDEEDGGSLKDTVNAALQQIEKKQYAAQLISRGISAERIHSYGFAFQGKEVLIG